MTIAIIMNVVTFKLFHASDGQIDLHILCMTTCLWMQFQSNRNITIKRHFQFLFCTNITKSTVFDMLRKKLLWRKRRGGIFFAENNRKGLHTNMLKYQKLQLYLLQNLHKVPLKSKRFIILFILFSNGERGKKYQKIIAQYLVSIY